jgi:hypothetical protein
MRGARRKNARLLRRSDWSRSALLPKKSARRKNARLLRRSDWSRSALLPNKSAWRISFKMIIIRNEQLSLNFNSL